MQLQPNSIQRVNAPSAFVLPVVPSSLAIELIDFVQVPASDKNRPLARINYLYHAGDGSGRLFVNDMRGKIYVIRNGALVPSPFLDIAAVRAPHFVASGASNSEVGVHTFAFHRDFNRKGAPGYGKFYTFHSEGDGLEDNGQVPVFRGPTAKPDHYNIVSEWSVDPNNPEKSIPHRAVRFCASLHIRTTTAAGSLVLTRMRHRHAIRTMGCSTFPSATAETPSRDQGKVRSIGWPRT